jgi:hypothetical protein
LVGQTAMVICIGVCRIEPDGLGAVGDCAIVITLVEVGLTPSYAALIHFRKPPALLVSTH